MTPHLSELLHELHTLGCHLSLTGDRLHLDAPKGRISPQLLERLKANKPALVMHLRQPGGGAVVPPVPRVPPQKRQVATERRPLVLALVVDGKPLTCIDPVSDSLEDAIRAQRERWGDRLQAIGEGAQG